MVLTEFAYYARIFTGFCVAFNSTAVFTVDCQTTSYGHALYRGNGVSQTTFSFYDRVRLGSFSSYQMYGVWFS
jgi:hypothetical protein